MRVEDMVLISVDDHTVEPPSMTEYFKDHVPAAYKDRVPRVIRRADGTDAWLIEGKEIATFGLNAVQGRPREAWGSDPASFDQVRPGTYDIHERVKDMDANGVLASLCFPSWPGIAGQFFVASEDRGYAEAMIRAYNDWHIDEWCNVYPGRFIPLSISGFPLGGEWMAGEIRRMAERGCHAVSLHPETWRAGHPDYHGDEWDPAWRACEDTGTVMVFHFGGMPTFMPRAPFDVIPTAMPFQTAIFAAELLWSPIMRRFPGVRLALAEGGIGWIPYFLEKADFVYDHHHLWTGADFGDKLPSQVFREHVQGCFIDDLTGLKARHDIGLEMITWECDYPHSDSTWPQAPEVLMKSLEAAEMSDEEIDMVTWSNAARWYQFDPFEHRTRQEATVAALRARAHDVDTTPREYGSGEHSHGLEHNAARFMSRSNEAVKDDS